MRRFFDVSLPATAGIIALGLIVWVATNDPAVSHTGLAPCLIGFSV